MGAKADAARKARLSVLMDEYRSVREEEIAAVHGQIGTLRYGVAGCVVLFGVAAQQHGDRYLGWAISLALVPLVVLFSAVIWMGEYERGARAGHYLSRLEGRVNALLGREADRPLRWESWLREAGNAPPRLIGGQHRYLLIACVFLGFQIASVVMGLHFYWHKHSEDPSRHWIVPAALVVNVTILLLILGYFRSAYERLREYTKEPGEPRPQVRQRFRMRAILYGMLLWVGFVSTPLPVWLTGAAVVFALHRLSVLEGLQLLWVLATPIVWMATVPLVSSRGLMRELFDRRIKPELKLDEKDRSRLRAARVEGQLSGWDPECLRKIKSHSPNAPSIGRRKYITLTTAALRDEDDLVGLLAHEMGHHRLHHLYPLSLSYLYLWLYFFVDDSLRRPREGKEGIGPLRAVARIGFTFLALPGWFAWVSLRLAWRFAEYDADRFACVSGFDKQLIRALKKADKRRIKKQPDSLSGYRDRAKNRLKQGRGLGYLPVPNEHPLPQRRIKKLKKRRQREKAFRPAPKLSASPAS